MVDLGGPLDISVAAQGVAEIEIRATNMHQKGFFQKGIFV
jgi:hypothetical protein